MHLTTAKESVGTDSGQAYCNPELLESLIDEANRSMARLAGIGLADQERDDGSMAKSGTRGESLIRRHSQEELEEIAGRIRAIESLILDAPRY